MDADRGGMMQRARRSKALQERKEEHIDICLSEDVEAEHNYWAEIHLLHEPLPELNYDDIETSTALLGRRLAAPIIIAAMTGGTEKGARINESLAAAAAELQIGMGVGSQRPALEDPSLAKGFRVVREYDIPLVMANLGAPQLVEQRGKRPITMDEIGQAMEMIGAHAVAVHLNFLQEIAQPGGDLNAEGCIDAIRDVARGFKVIAKETGGGMPREAAARLKSAGIAAIDIGGMGGTSFSAVEHHRAVLRGARLLARVGKTFWNWGIPAPAALCQAAVGLPIIATGGLRTGLDAAKAIAMGASAAGFARALLKPAMDGKKAVRTELEAIVAELKTAMFLTASQHIPALHSKRWIATGRTREWLEQL
ncbi:MAG: type 2 isopentenyl-diphosphate Delta-isomerase [Candidatus Thermoplasmatota archaeon]